MNAKHAILLSAICLATTGAMAGEITIDNTPSASSTSRAQVKAEVLKARKAGDLVAAGEAYQGGVAVPGTSSVARSDVKAQFLAAREGGHLLAAGEGSYKDADVDLSGSTLTRSDVKSEVLAARKAGELLPAGEGYYSESPTRRHVASNGNALQSFAKVFRR